MSPPAVSTTRPVHGQDENFYKQELLIAGSLEAVWQGRHRITSLFRRWKLWHVEVKGDQIFYHKMQSISANSATDAVWYTLDLTWLSDMYVTESSRVANNELVLRFVQDDHTLHFRLPSKVTGPILAEWLVAFRKVQKSQQDRRRLGSMADNESAWPGEESQPVQRPRGSSLAAPSVTLVAPKPAVQVSQAESVTEEKSDFSSAVEQATLTAPRRAPPAVPPLNPQYQPVNQEQQERFVEVPVVKSQNTSTTVAPAPTIQPPVENKELLVKAQFSTTPATGNIGTDQSVLDNPPSVAQS
jgi:hypothetical protein